MELLESLSLNPLFEGLSADELSGLSTAFQTSFFSENTRIIREGEPSDHLYFILEGAVEVSFLDCRGNRIFLGKLPPGELFGILDILEFSPFAYRALQGVKLAAVSLESLRKLKSNRFWENMMAAAACRFNQYYLLKENKSVWSLSADKEGRADWDRELNVLQSLGLALTSGVYDLNGLLQFLVEATGSLLGARGCILRLLDEGVKKLRIKAASGLGKEVIRESTQKMGEGVAGWVVQTGQPVLINDLSQDPRFSNSAKTIVSSLINVPIKIRGEVIGTLTVFDKFNPRNTSAKDFVEDDLKLMKVISTQAAIAIENAQLHEKLVESQEGSRRDLGEKLEVLKKSPVLRRLKNQISAYAENNRPVLIWAEDGNGKATVAREIHSESGRRDQPFTELGCKGKSEEELERIIFGAFRKTAGVDGVLESAHHGTACLADIDCLSRKLQLKLLQYLETGRYRQMGGREYRYSDVKLICTVVDNLEEEIKDELFDERLYGLLTGQLLRILPLRERKKDIPVLVEHFLRKYAPPGKSFEITPGAMGKILDHDWPGNVAELETTVQHAGILAEGNLISRRYILMMRQKIRGKTEVNLLRVPQVERFFKAAWYPDGIAFFALAGLLGMGYLYLHPDPQIREVSLILSWALGWPMLFGSAFFLARFWCAVCPFRLAGNVVKKIVPDRLMISRENLSYGIGVGSLSAAGVLWVEHLTDMHHNPAATFLLLAFIMLGAVLVNGFTKSHLWCKEQCPLGFMCRIFSPVSLAALRTNKNICTSRCNTHECFQGTKKVAGCVMDIHPFSLDSNQNCILCGNCVKNCPKKSMRLNYRRIPTELWAAKNPEIWSSWLAVGLVFYVVFENIVGSGWKTDKYLISSILYSIRDNRLVYTLAFWLVMSLAYLFIKAVSRVDFEPEKFAGRMGYCYIPLALAGFMAVYADPFLTRWLPLMDRFLNFSLLSPNDIYLYFSGKVVWVQLVLVCLGIFGSFYAIHELTLGSGWKKMISFGCLGLISWGMIWSFSLPF